MKTGLFIDRDGTLNEMVYDTTHGLLDSPRRPEQVVLRKGAAAFLKQARTLGYEIVVVSNQPGIAKGTLTVQELEAVNRRISILLADEGAGWDDLRCCPHHPAEGTECDCRKPKPGLILDAARVRDIDLSRSWMVGDGLVDVQAGNRAGCRTILITSLKIEHVERFFSLEDTMPTALAADFTEALQIIRNLP